MNIIADAIPPKAKRPPIPLPRGTIKSQPKASSAAPTKPVTIKIQLIGLDPESAGIFCARKVSATAPAMGIPPTMVVAASPPDLIDLGRGDGL